MRQINLELEPFPPMNAKIHFEVQDWYLSHQDEIDIELDVEIMNL